MDCDKIKIWLSDYKDGELDESTKSTVEAHLENCPECKQALDDLKFYESILSQLDPVKSPGDLKEKILEKIDHGLEKQYVPFRQTAYYRIGRIAAAAILILAILLIPTINQPAQIEITYAKRVVKKGKGPTEEKRESEEVRLVREMAELSNGELVHIQYGDETGLVDYIEIEIPKSDYKSFAERYNQEDIFETISPEPPAGRRNNLSIRIYYPGRRFVTGDFNGDGMGDLLAHYFRGKYKGTWHIATNCVDSFGAPAPVTMHKELQYVSIPNQLIAGDFNNDEYDDLIAGSYNNSFTTDWSLVLNDKRGNFQDKYNLTFSNDSILQQGLFHVHAADINGDRADDFIVHFLDGELFDQWWCYLNKGDLDFEEPVLLQIHNLNDTLAARSKVFFMDYNGDAKDDMLVYWKTKYDPDWWLSLNLNNLQFSTPVSLIRAYQGAYYPYILDFNGNGYDEMIVKEGQEDMFGGWFVWSNDKGVAFKGDKMINFGGMDNFVIE